MNFGFQEIDGEEVGLLETYAFRQDFRINVEIMKARDKLLCVCQITTDNAARAPIRAEFWMKKIVYPCWRLWVTEFMLSIWNKATNEMPANGTQFVGNCWRPTLQATWIHQGRFSNSYSSYMIKPISAQVIRYGPYHMAHVICSSEYNLKTYEKTEW